MWGSGVRAAMAFVVALSVGCGGDAPPALDGGSGGGADAGPSLSVAPPLAPALTPCPAGWLEVPEEPAAVCVPWPAGEGGECAAHEARFVGDSACATVGTDCPVGDLPADLPTDTPIHHVLAGASGGDGSRTRPFATIAQAMAEAGAGDMIAVGKGTYDEPVTLRPGVTLRGACVAQTLLTSSAASTSAGIISASGSGGRVENLRVGESRRGGLFAIRDTTSLEVRDVVVHDAEIVGAVASLGGVITAENLVVRGTRPHPVMGYFGQGLDAEGGGSMAVDRGVFDGNGELGVWAIGAGSALDLVDVVVRDTRSNVSDGTLGRGVEVEDGGSISIRRGLVEGNRELAVDARDAGSRVALEDVVVRATLGNDATDLGGRGLNVENGAAAELARVLIDENRDVGAFADDRAQLIGTDVVIRDTALGGPESGDGRGVAVQAGATVVLERAVIARSNSYGAFAHGGSLRLTDVHVRDNRDRGVVASSGANAELRWTSLERNVDFGALATGVGSTLVLEHAAFRDTLPRPEDLTFGRGLQAQIGGTIEGSHVLIDGSRELGLTAVGGASHVTLSGLVVTNTRVSDCPPEVCDAQPPGVGVGSYLSALIRLEDFVIDGSALCGGHLGAAGEMDLRGGLVTHNPIGMCLQVEGFDVERLTDTVLYVDNGVNLDSTELPIPDSAPMSVPVP